VDTRLRPPDDEGRREETRCPDGGVCVLCSFMAAPLSAADRFACIVASLCRAIAARGAAPALAGPLAALLWGRLHRLAARFAAIVARVAVGAGPVVARARRRPAPRPAPVSPRPRLPEGFGWLLRPVPEAAAYASQLRHLLADPEVVALLTAAPQLARLLRPLCRSLGIRPMPALPPPVRPQRPPPPAPASSGPGSTASPAPAAYLAAAPPAPA